MGPVPGEGVRRSLLLSAGGSVAAGYGAVLLDEDGGLETMNADTPRELEVAGLLLAGFSAPHIAKLLVLSPYTAREHLKAIFAKVGVSSQQELIARLYFGEYLPRMAGGAAPGPTGWFP